MPRSPALTPLSVVVSLFAAVLGAVLVGGCRNSCQEICPRMASYARDCGFEVTQDEVRACVAGQAGAASRDDRAVCRAAGDRATLRAEWTCDDLADYWAARGAPGVWDSGL